jgi:hypothetical protein
MKLQSVLLVVMKRRIFNFIDDVEGRHGWRVNYFEIKKESQEILCEK